MLDPISIRPYQQGDVPALAALLDKAKFLLGDADFSAKGSHLVYFLDSARSGIVGLFEMRVVATRHLKTDEPSLLITKVALSPEYLQEEYVRSMLLYAFGEARRLKVNRIYALGEELPYEKELGFGLAAPKGIYLDGKAEESIPLLRMKNLGEDIFDPGFVNLL